MASRWAAPPFGFPEERDDAWDLVFKVKYNGTLKRYNARVNGSNLDHNLATLRSKIASAFKLSSDAEFILTYTDEDGDMVMLDDENDLRDAAINQKLNPLRINVLLKNSNAGAPRTKQQASYSRSPRSTALEDQLAQVKLAIDEALKFVPEQVPSVLAKLSHDSRSRAASSAPLLAELVDRLATLMTSNGKMQSGPVDGSSRNTEVETGSAPQSSHMQNSESSKAPDLKSVLPEDPKAPVYPSVEDPLIFACSGGKKSDCKRGIGSERKTRCDLQNKGKSISSAVPPVSTAHNPIHYPLAPSVGENKLRYWPTYGSNGLFSGGLQSRCPLPPVVTPYYQHLGSSGNVYSDWQSSFPPPANTFSPPKLDVHSSLGTYVPSKDGIYSFGNSNKYGVPSSVSNNPEGRYSFGRSYNYGSIPQHALHKWIQCDGCEVTPIVGPRYKSNVKPDYDLCGACFSRVGNESEYTRIDKPVSVNNRKFLGHLQQGELKLECCFIKDVTVPDGTSMAPSTPFTKIWRMRNIGCTVWPFGTQVIWVGGDQFAVQSSVKLGISVNGIAGGQEIDVGVNFLAPPKPGRYISYWRLASPSGKKFGQQIWVLIQVVEPIQTSKQSDAINLNLPPAASSTGLKPFVFSGPRDPIVHTLPQHYHDSIINLEFESEPDSPTAPNFQHLGSSCSEMLARFHEPIPKESKPASSDVPSLPTAVKQGQIPVTDPHGLFAGPASTSMPADVPAPETIPLPKSVSSAAPVSAPYVHAPASVPNASLPDKIINNMEDKLLRELQQLGFGQVDLNKEILRRNKYDLEQSVEDLCGISDWDPLLGELSELGFNDAEMKTQVASEDGGASIKRLVKNIEARVKKYPVTSARALST